MIWTIVLLGLAAGDVDSGPEKSAKLPPLKALVVTGHNAEKIIDFSVVPKNSVTVFMVIGDAKFDRPMNRFIKTLDGKLVEDFKRITAVALFPTDDEDKMKTYLPKVQMSVKYEKTVLAVVKGKNGPKDWSINADAHLTVIVAAEGQVVARFGYKSVNETDVPNVVAVLKKIMYTK